MARKFFSGNTVEQALLSAARALGVEPEQIAYTLRDKKHGFVKVRRRVVIEVDPDAPLKSEQAETEVEASGRRESTLVGDEPSGGDVMSVAARDESELAEDALDEDTFEEEPLESEELEESRGEDAAKAPWSGGRGLLEDEDDSPREEDAAGPPPRGAEERAPERQVAASAEGNRGQKPPRSRGGRRREPEPEPAIESSRELVSPEEAVDLALDEITHFLCVDVSWEVEEVEDGFEIEIEGPDQEWLLDDDGNLLLAIEHLLPRMIRSLSGQSRSCSVDCDGFHSSHEEHLREIASRAAEKVIRSGRPQVLEPMNPADRRIVHLHLVNDPTVSTHSKGDGLFKRVKISPAKPS